jgi:hypothetical protein
MGRDYASQVQIGEPSRRKTIRGAHARRMRIAMARVAAVDNGLRPISTGVKLSERSVRVVGYPEVIGWRLARRWVPRSRHVERDSAISIAGLLLRLRKTLNLVQCYNLLFKLLVESRVSSW